jgi:hypothetical protein
LTKERVGLNGRHVADCVLAGKKTLMARQQQSQSEIREHLAEQLDRRFAKRADATVAQAL